MLDPRICVKQYKYANIDIYMEQINHCTFEWASQTFTWVKLTHPMEWVTENIGTDVRNKRGDTLVKYVSQDTGYRIPHERRRKVFETSGSQTKNEIDVVVTKQASHDHSHRCLLSCQRR